jgi:uncharacterized protein
MKHLVIYHANCMDGMAAAMAAQWILEDSAEYHAANHYDTEFPIVEAPTRIFFLDFVYKPDIMANYASIPGIDLIILDHHKDAYEQLRSIPEINLMYCDSSQSGAGLAWQYFHGIAPMPKMLRHIQDRDLWQFNIPGTKEVAAYIKAHKPECIEDMTMLVFENMSHVYETGKELLLLQAVQIEETLKNARGVTIDIIGPDSPQSFPVTITMINTMGSLISDTGDAWLQKSGENMVLLYYDNKYRRVFSVRAAKNYNGLFIAKAFGGGGHPGACGFSVSRDHPLARL